MFTVETSLREQNVRDIDLKLGFPIVKRLAFGDHRGMLLDEMPLTRDRMLVKAVQKE